MRLGVPTSARSAFFGRRIAVLAVASASLLTTGGVAFAAPGTSPGCSALNGGFSGGTGSGTSIGTGFNAGDIISLTITAAGIGDTLGLYDSTASTELVSESFIVGTRDYLVPAATGNTLAISGMRFDSASDFSWSCIPGSGGGGSGTDSDNLAKMQEDGWDWRALFSGYAWANAVYPELDQAFLDMAFNGGFGTSGTILNRDEYAHYAAFWRSDLISKRTFAPPGPDAPYDVHEEYYHYHVQALRDYDRLFAAGLVPSVTGGRGQGGIWQATLRWIEDPASAVSSYLPQSRPETANAVDEAFSALTDWTVSTTFVPYATTWADVRGTGFDSAANAQTGRQINTVAGVTYRATPDFVVGAFAGYEAFGYDFTALNGQLTGSGGTLGAYAGLQITPVLRWKAMAAWTGLSYNGQAGAATGSFNASRWMLSSELSGRFDLGTFVVEPSADVMALWESQTGYTDSLGVVHAARNFSTGRVALGAKATAPQSPGGITPYLGLYGDWRFASTAAPATGNGLSARMTGGVTMPVFANGTLSLGVEYGGIGTNSRTISGNARLSVPF